MRTNKYFLIKLLHYCVLTDKFNCLCCVIRESLPVQYYNCSDCDEFCTKKTVVRCVMKSQSSLCLQICQIIYVNSTISLSSLILLFFLNIASNVQFPIPVFNPRHVFSQSVTSEKHIKLVDQHPTCIKQASMKILVFSPSNKCKL